MPTLLRYSTIAANTLLSFAPWLSCLTVSQQHRWLLFPLMKETRLAKRTQLWATRETRATQRSGQGQRQEQQLPVLLPVIRRQGRRRYHQCAPTTNTAHCAPVPTRRLIRRATSARRTSHQDRTPFVNALIRAALSPTYYNRRSHQVTASMPVHRQKTVVILVSLLTARVALQIWLSTPAPVVDEASAVHVYFN